MDYPTQGRHIYAARSVPNISLLKESGFMLMEMPNPPIILSRGDEKLSLESHTLQEVAFLRTGMAGKFVSRNTHFSAGCPRKYTICISL
jgi:hypothetical protein